MKNGSRKTKIIVTFLVISLLCCAYAVWEEIPDLINADKPFIDFTDSIGKSVGNAQEAYRKANPTPIPTPIPKPTATPSPIPTEIPPNEIIVKLTVGDEKKSGSGEAIWFDGKMINSFDELKNVILDCDLDGKVIVLEDYYAEKTAFINVKKVLDALEISYRTETKDGMLGGAE